MRGGKHRRRIPTVEEQIGADPAAAIPMPTDPEVLRALLGPTAGRAPNPAVDAVVARINGDDDAAAVADARAALYQDAPFREGGIPPKWGCSTSAHEHLGWCANCPDVNGNAELSAWRVLAAGHPAPNYAWGIGVSRG